GSVGRWVVRRPCARNNYSDATTPPIPRSTAMPACSRPPGSPHRWRETMIQVPQALIDSLIKPRRGMLVDGEWSRSGSLGSYVRHAPVNGEPLGEVPMGGEAEVNRAVEAARRAA